MPAAPSKMVLIEPKHSLMMPFFGAGELFDDLIVDLRNVLGEGLQECVQIKVLNTLVEMLTGVLSILLHLRVVHESDGDVVRFAHRGGLTPRWRLDTA